jgi:signal transduction histidine kinase
MLHEFLSANRSELIDRCRTKVALRAVPATPGAPMDHGVPIFLDQLIKTLEIEQTPNRQRSRKVSGPSGGNPALSEIGEAAALHGRELLRQGFTVDQVVHEYGDLCQAVTDLAFERSETIDIDEFRTLNRCLDNAIADAVTEYSYERDTLATNGERALNERQGFFVHELRNHVNTATLALSVIKLGGVGLSGATGAVLDRSLAGLRSLIERSVIDVRAAAGLPARKQLLSLAAFIAEVKGAALLEAQARQCTLDVSDIDPTLAIDVDRDLLYSALGNLLQNAFKFTYQHTEVTLNAYAAADRILIEVADNCGGLPSGNAERMFVPFTQGSGDRSGLGLGLSITRRGVEANGGILRVRDVPGTGCVFTIDLPRHLLPIRPSAQG